MKVQVKSFTHQTFVGTSTLHLHTPKHDAEQNEQWLVGLHDVSQTQHLGVHWPIKAAMLVWQLKFQKFEFKLS